MQQLCLKNKYKQTEMNSIVYKTNINNQKRAALFTKTTETNRNEQLLYKINTNQQKQTGQFTEPTYKKSLVYLKSIIFIYCWTHHKQREKNKDSFFFLFV